MYEKKFVHFTVGDTTGGMNDVHVRRNIYLDVDKFNEAKCLIPSENIVCMVTQCQKAALPL